MDDDTLRQVLRLTKKAGIRKVGNMLFGQKTVRSGMIRADRAGFGQIGQKAVRPGRKQSDHKKDENQIESDDTMKSFEEEKDDEKEGGSVPKQSPAKLEAGNDRILRSAVAKVKPIEHL